MTLLQGLPGADTGDLTLESFQFWGEALKVRKVQAQYEVLASDANVHDRSIDEEMKAQGKMDFTQFRHDCPQFGLLCSPMDFAELGSGSVLYFFLLRFMILLLLLFLCLQIAVIVKYKEQDWTGGWQWHDWSEGWSLNNDPCECIGINNGQTGPADIPDYGTSCGAWDIDWCVQGHAAKPGQWCCQAWCYADQNCPAARDTARPSMSNRHYNGLVRATTECEQDAAVEAMCTGVFASDVLFDEAGVTDSEDGWNAFWFISVSPGALGPDQCDNVALPILYFCCVVLMVVLCIVMHQVLIVADKKLDSNSTLPNDFAIMASGLPSTATDETAIAEFFEKHAVRGKTTEIVKVVIGWDFPEFRAKLHKAREIAAQISRLDPDDPRIKELTVEQQLIFKELGTTTDTGKGLKSSGIVVVTFRFQHDLRACLQRWTSFYARWFCRDVQDIGFLPAGNGLRWGSKLPCFPVGDPPRAVNVVRVERAANPGDINWQELGVPMQERYKLAAKTNGLMFVVTLISFFCIWGLYRLQGTIEGSSVQYLSFLPSFGVMITNAVCTFASKSFGVWEVHETWTSQQFSQAVKMSVAMCVNTAGVIWFSEARPEEWYDDGGLINQVFYLLAINCLIPPVLIWLDIGFCIKRCRRRNLTQEKIDEWNKKIKAGEAREVTAKIRAYMKFYEPSELNNPRRYAMALKQLICCSIYMPVLPVTTVIGIVGLILQYATDKYMLLRCYQRPARPQNAILARYTLTFVRCVGPVGISVAFYVFLSPSWKQKSQVLFWFLVSMAIGAGSAMLPVSLLRTVLGIRLSERWASARITDEESYDYYKAQYMWSRDQKYHKDHFLYKKLREDKNPEFLTLGRGSAVKSEDVKEGYGAMTSSAASDVADGACSGRLVLKGGLVAGDELEPSAVSKKTAPPAPLPISVPDPIETSLVSVSHDDLGESTEPSEPIAAVLIPDSMEGTWEFETKSGFVPCNDDCQSYIERMYMRYLREGTRGRINVRTKVGHKDITLSVDFERMTQRGPDAKIRTIRRVPCT